MDSFYTLPGENVSTLHEKIVVTWEDFFLSIIWQKSSYIIYGERVPMLQGFL